MATPPTLPLSLLSLLSLLALTNTVGAQTSVKLGDVVHNLLFPSHELLGGLERVINDVNKLDNTVNSCGKRQVCEAMSLGQVIERSDGSLEQEAGLLRQAVDTAGEVIFQLARPFMEAAGLGRVARREQSVTEFLVDIIDSAIIGVTRVLAGRRFSRQLEEFSPFLTFVEPVSNVLRLIPKHFYGNIVDLAVDVTGVANRRSGGYNLVRSAGLGYFYGGGDDSICRNLNPDIFGNGPHCDSDEGGIHPLAMLNPINSNELGKTVRLGGGEMNPLMDRSRNANPTTHVSFDYKLTDLLEPTKMLCRMDGVLGAVNGHVTYNNDGESMADVEADYEVEEEVSIRRVDMDEPLDMEELDEDSKLLVQEMNRLKRKVKTSRGGTKQAAKKEMTSEERFQDYCNKMNMEEIEVMLAEKHNITMDSEEDNMETYEDYEDYESSGDVEYESVVSIDRKNRDEKQEEEQEQEEQEMKEEDDYVETVDNQMTDIETIARIGDRSLLSEKLEVEAGTEVETVQSLINRFKVAANGRVEKVLQLDRKKGEPVLLIQFDSTQYRDAVLRSSRMPGARSTTNVRFRRPKVKDLKHVVNLVRRH